jgi:hypothetical protein
VVLKVVSKMQNGSVHRSKDNESHAIINMLSWTLEDITKCLYHITECMSYLSLLLTYVIHIHYGTYHNVFE